MIKVFNGESFSGTAVCIGNFDGVHLAHRRLIEETVSEAKKEGLKSAVYTFYPHPDEFFGKKQEKITSEADKEGLIESLGADIYYCQKCDEAFLSKSPEEFCKDVLKEKLGAKKVFVGYDFTFGKNGSGKAEDLYVLGKRFGFDAVILPEMKIGGEAVKSTAVRGYIKEGKIEKANEMLGRAHFYSGRVFRAKMLGRTIGFPTANIYPEEGLILPPFGVYASKVLIGEKMYPGVSNIGLNPTVEHGTKPKIETNIMDFSGDIYGEKIKVFLYKWIRPEMKFSGVEDLMLRIKKDSDEAKKIIDKTHFVW